MNRNAFIEAVIVMVREQPFDQLSFAGGTIQFERLRNDDLQRIYDVYEVSNGSDSVILKKSSSLYEANVSAFIGTMSQKVALPPIKSLVNASGERLILYPRANSDTINDISEYMEAVESLALLQTIELDKCLQSIKVWDLRREERVDLLRQYDNSELPDLVEALLERLSMQPQRLLHGDAIPLNVVKFGNRSIWIDWELACLGPYSLDLGRFLGDYNHKKPWIPLEWRNDLKDCYYRNLQMSPSSIEINSFERDLNDAIAYNYLAIVCAFLKNHWERNDWFKDNWNRLRGCLSE